MKRLATLLTAASLTFVPVGPAEATVEKPTITELKTYAKGYITGRVGLREADRQWGCFHKIIYRESRWLHTAENGKYYGLGQMANSKRYHRGKPYHQVRAAYAYMVHRYESPCGAWKFWSHHHWY